MGPDCNAVAAAVVAVGIGFSDADFSTLCAKTRERVRPRAGSEDGSPLAQGTHGKGLASNRLSKNRAWHKACSSFDRG